MVKPSSTVPWKCYLPKEVILGNIEEKLRALASAGSFVTHKREKHSHDCSCLQLI